MKRKKERKKEKQISFCTFWSPVKCQLFSVILKLCRNLAPFSTKADLREVYKSYALTRDRLTLSPNNLLNISLSLSLSLSLQESYAVPKRKLPDNKAISKTVNARCDEKITPIMTTFYIWGKESCVAQWLSTWEMDWTNRVQILD